MGNLFINEKDFPLIHKIAGDINEIETVKPKYHIRMIEISRAYHWKNSILDFAIMIYDVNDAFP